ncbi:hypothetical protein D3C78_1076090 [compost metagenome]
MRDATRLAMRRPMPMSVSSSLRLRLPVYCSSCSHSALLASSCGGRLSMPSARRACVSSFSPRSADSLCADVLRWWRILERARAVFTKPSQAGLGVASSAVMISITSPLLSSVRSGTSSLLILAAVVWLPILLWMA